MKSVAEQIQNLLDDVKAYGSEPSDGMKRVLLSRIESAAQALVGQERPADPGPWSMSPDGLLISSDNFQHDVQLKVRVTGDFYGEADKAAYSRRLVSQLNQSVPLKEGLPKEPPAHLIHSMCMRYRHDYGIISPEHQEATRRTMRQLYEEVSGHGFFNW